MEGREKYILAVDDDQDILELMRVRLEIEGYKVSLASNADDAWVILLREHRYIEAVLLDRCMPGGVINGLDLLRKIKKHDDMRDIPAIIVSGLFEKSEIIEGIQAGANYYLTKPFSKEVLLSIVNAAVQDYEDEQMLRKRLNGHERVANSIRECSLEFKLFEEVHDISVFLSSLFPEPGRVAMGIQEIVRNAVEHGNLGITYDEKTSLIKENNLLREIMKREQEEEYKARKVAIDFKCIDGEYVLRVKDDGNGFNWEDYMEVSPERVTDNHGRGIAMANLCCFDNISYIDNGNEVVCRVKNELALNFV